MVGAAKLSVLLLPLVAMSLRRQRTIHMASSGITVACSIVNSCFAANELA